MRHIFVVLFTLLVLISCKDNPVKPEPPKAEFKPFRIGAWWATSNDEADYIGVNKQKGDTLLITSPDSMGIKIELIDGSDPDLQRFYFSFTDSSITEEIGNKLLGQLWIDYGVAPNYIVKFSYGIHFHTGVLTSRNELGYRCDAPELPVEEKTLQYDLLYENNLDSAYAVYKFRIDGMIQMIDSLGC